MPLIYEPNGRAQEYSFLALNHYKGCGHGCTYCYVPGVTRNPDVHSKQSVRRDLFWQLEKDAPKYAHSRKRVLLSFSTDPYQPLDITTKATRRVIEILRAWNVPFTVLTKGGQRAIRDFDLYGPHDQFAATLTFTDQHQSLKVEPYAATPLNRCAALKIAHERRIATWVSLEPVIEPSQSLNLIDMTHEYVDLYKIGITNHIETDMTPGAWRQFGEAAIRLCWHYCVDFYIKRDLAKHMGDFKYENTDNRIVTERSTGSESE